jgi:hypothetical protein
MPEIPPMRNCSAFAAAAPASPVPISLYGLPVAAALPAPCRTGARCRARLYVGYHDLPNFILFWWTAKRLSAKEHLCHAVNG